MVDLHGSNVMHVIVHVYVPQSHSWPVSVVDSVEDIAEDIVLVILVVVVVMQHGLEHVVLQSSIKAT